jgi:hypothetical protein
VHRRSKSKFKIDSGEEIRPSTECTYLGTKIDETTDYTTEIEHRSNQTRKAINALNSIWWHKYITKNNKIYLRSNNSEHFDVWSRSMANIYQRNKQDFATEMDVLRRSARKSRLERMKNELTKKIMGVKENPDIIDIIEKKRLQWFGHVKKMQEESLPILVMDWIQGNEEKEEVQEKDGWKLYEQS